MAHFKVNFLLLSSLLGLCLAVIDDELMRKLSSGDSAEILVDFQGSNTRSIQRISGRSFHSRVSRVKALTKSLQEDADQSQGPVQSYLDGNGVKYESFWASNQIVVKDADLKTAKGIDSFPQVSNVYMVPSMPWDRLRPGANDTNSTVEWGIEMIGADQVWSMFNITGEGVVVANIDSGVRGTHEALAGNWRQDHGWFDPYDFKQLPHDDVGHGTHVMGTMVGQGGIGVAPGATWIACRGCNDQGCDTIQLLMCGQFMLQPTNPDGTDADATKIPDVINNSWGSNRGGNPWYNPMIAAWKAAGIMHVFAFGNSGPLCASGGSPGDSSVAFAVGSTDMEDQLSIFSSKGPSFGFPHGVIIKPDISAPGSDVRSAWHTGDQEYNTISGTSMASPHVAGLMALMLSGKRAQTGDQALRLNFDEVVEDLEKTVVTEGLSLGFLNIACDRIPFLGEQKFPNTQFGHGRVNALAAVTATLKRGTEGGDEQAGARCGAC